MSSDSFAAEKPVSYSHLKEDSIPSSPLAIEEGRSHATKASPASRRRLYIGMGVFFLLASIAVAALLIVRLRSSGSNGDAAAPVSGYDPTIQGSGQRPQPAEDLPKSTTADPTYVHQLNMPPRLQWNENYGYCGSTSMICSSMYFGAWVSQYDNRYIASNATNQKKEESQLLLGVNDYFAATQHKLTNELWDYSDTNVQHFFVWIKKHILQGHPVIIGIYENESVFGNDPPDPDYDHIVPVTGWGSNHALTDLSYYADDVIYFSDNGLYTPDGTDPIYHISAQVGVFAQSRKNADAKSAAVYSVNGAPTSSDPNFGIAITGIVDIHNNCLPTRVDSNVNYESPEIVDGSNTRPAAMAMVLTVTASGLTSGTAYKLYQYSAFENVPSSQFNANAGNAAATFSFTATSDTYQQTVNIKSNEMAIFRTVAASAP